MTLPADFRMPTREELLAMTPEERLGLQWQISQAEWMERNGTTEEPVFRRDVARVIRRVPK